MKNKQKESPCFLWFKMEKFNDDNKNIDISLHDFKKYFRLVENKFYPLCHNLSVNSKNRREKSYSLFYCMSATSIFMFIQEYGLLNKERINLLQKKKESVMLTNWLVYDEKNQYNIKNFYQMQKLKN